ncbi:hypothetical protein B0H14DRAFT_3557526 [Mycena olivaceomarginata]|nr:hypothetical protein B0H14DRAFT_3557526 [Mycena olivaceomarginata]
MSAPPPYAIQVARPNPKRTSVLLWSERGITMIIPPHPISFVFDIRTEALSPLPLLHDALHVGTDDFAWNFGDAGDDGGKAGYDAYEEGEGNSEDLYYAKTYADVLPGLYHAQFVFVGIDAAEMDLEEGQLIHVLGSRATAAHEDGAEGEGDGGDVNAMVGVRTDAGTVWGELWAAAAAAAAPAAAGANATPAPPPERRVLVPDSYIMLVCGEGEREGDLGFEIRYHSRGTIISLLCDALEDEIEGLNELSKG